MLNTTLCYIENDGAYLMLHRVKKKNDLNEGKWIGIGGKFEEGETAEECLLREVREETGIALKKYTLRGIVRFVSDRYPEELMYLYTANVPDRTIPQECTEGELAWIPIFDVPSLPLWEGDKIFLDLLLKDTPFFRLTVVYEGDKLVHSEFHFEDENLAQGKDEPTTGRGIE